MKTLAVKYRPTSFDEVVEQGPIKAILQHQIKTSTFKNAYLFTGGAGTGKTTCARIVAKDINDGKGNPVEIDAASNNGVDNVREIIDNSRFKAIDAKYKVYIIDECHMLSAGAWNAMLKLLEEPPANTVFILCTTDPQKIPNTILSRVQRYDFQRLSFRAIVNHLEYIVNEEAAEDKENPHSYEVSALEYIAKIADGGMRDAITMLDKVMSYSTNVSLQNVIEALGTADYAIMVDLANQIVDQKSSEALLTINKVYRSGVDIKQFVRQFCEFLLDVRKYQMFNSFDYIRIPETMKDSLDSVATADPALVKKMLETMLRVNQEIKWETIPKPMLEAEVLLLCE